MFCFYKSPECQSKLFTLFFISLPSNIYIPSFFWHNMLIFFLPDAAADKPRWSGSPLLLRAGPHQCGLRAVHRGQTWVLSAAGLRDPLPWLCSQVGQVEWVQIIEALTRMWPDPLHSPLCRWQFATESADIGFGVFLKERKGEWKKATQMQEVVPSQRYNAHLVPEDGSLICQQPGVCKWAPAAIRQKWWSSVLIRDWFFTDVLRFDNTYSIFQTKRVSFTVEVLLPDHMPCPEVAGGVQNTQAEDSNQSAPRWHRACQIGCYSWAQPEKLDLYLHAVNM